MDMESDGSISYIMPNEAGVYEVRDTPSGSEITKKAYPPTPTKVFNKGQDVRIHKDNIVRSMCNGQFEGYTTKLSDLGQKAIKYYTKGGVCKICDYYMPDTYYSLIGNVYKIRKFKNEEYYLLTNPINGKVLMLDDEPVKVCHHSLKQVKIVQCKGNRLNFLTECDTTIEEPVKEKVEPIKKNQNFLNGIDF